MDNVIKKAAEILVECGYARKSIYDSRCVSTENKFEFLVDPFADTLEGRRQADVIEDWLNFNQRDMLENRSKHWAIGVVGSDGKPNGRTSRDWRLDRIKWCLEQLA